MRQRRSTVAQAGFTIVELMIATLVFSVILVIITSGIIHFTQDYYKGVNQSATQTAARTAITTIAQNLQYGGGNVGLNLEETPDSSVDRYYCVGAMQINYKLGEKVEDGGYLFITTREPDPVGCKPRTYDPTKPGREILGPKMRLTDLSIGQIGGGASNLFTVTAGVAFGDPDLLCASDVAPGGDGGCTAGDPDLSPDPAIFDWKGHGPKITCKGGAGSQFCAFSHLTTQITSRFQAGP